MKALKSDFKVAIDARTKSGEGRDETATCPYFEDVRCYIARPPRGH